MIKNLQYGNLYKFQVSLGLVLFLFPFFFTYLLWTSDCGLFISHEEYLKYSPEVRKLFDNKLNIFIFLNTSSITVLFFCFFIYSGLYYMSIGLNNWKKLQLTEDELLHLKMRRMEDPNNKTIEIDNNEEPVSYDPSAKKGNENFTSSTTTRSSAIKRRGFIVDETKNHYSLLEAACAEYLKYKSGDSYDIYKNVRVSSDMDGIIDIVALRKTGNTGVDILYEIKIGESFLNNFQHLLHRITRKQDRYASKLGRTCKAVILAVVPQENIKDCLQRAKKHKREIESENIVIELISKESLESFMPPPLPAVQKV